MSFVPPGAKGTTKRTGFSGNAALAPAAPIVHATHIANFIERMRRSPRRLLLGLVPAGELGFVAFHLRTVEIPREALAHVRRRLLVHGCGKSGQLAQPLA